ncbi:hypothetical protein ACOSQ2_025106 [Xanthoceras sorbifolium]
MMHSPQIPLSRHTYNRLVKARTVPSDAPRSDEEREHEQGLGQQDHAPMVHEQHEAPHLHDDCLLTAIAAIQASFEGRLDLVEARITSRLDVMEENMIGLGHRMNTMGQNIDRIEASVIQQYFRRRSRTPPPPPSR